MPEKIVVVAIGSRGDVQPYIALCQGLDRYGYDAVLATNPSLCALVESYGVRAAPVGPPVDMGLEGARLWAKSGNNMWLGLIRVMSLASRLVEAAYPDIYELCRDASLVIVTDPTAGAAEAENLGLPWVSATLQPGRVPVPSKQGPLGRAFFSVFSKLMVLPINRYRRRVGAPGVKDIGSMMSSRLVLVPVSPHVVPPDPRWPPHVHLTGYWTARSPQDWQPPADLLAFLERGERPVAISLGAMSLAGEHSRRTAEMVLEAVRLSGVRAVVQGWDEALKGIALPEDIYHAGSLPHTWLFSQVSAVVHHGGFGTTASALTAGLPAVVIPHIIDQFYWGQIVSEKGAGLSIPRAKLTVEGLAMALHRVLNDSEMRQTAAAAGGQIHSEPDGVDCAVELLRAVVEPA